MELIASITKTVVELLTNIVNTFVSICVMKEEDANEFIASLPVIE